MAKFLNLGFNKYSDGMLETLFQAIETAMTGNPNFTVAAELTAASAALAAYMAALADAAGGDKSKIATKNEKRVDAIAAFIKMGLMVEAQSEGNLAKLTSSLYPLRKTKTPMPPVSPSDINSLQQGQNSGEMEVACNTIPGARLYEFQCSLEESGTWDSKSSTKAKMLFTGLQAGKVYWFRVVVYGINQQQVMGNAISKMVI